MIDKVKKDANNETKINRNALLESKNIIDVFKYWAVENKHISAIESGNYQMTYGELDEISDRLATLLKNLGIHNKSIVAIANERSVHSVVCLLAILKAGCAYISIDIDASIERTEDILKDAKISIILSHNKRSIGKFRKLAGFDNVINILCDESIKEGIELDYDTDVAYISYTSGTTGKPKGVMISHESIIRLSKCSKYYCISSSDKVLFFSPLTFDASTFEVWVTLLNGAKLVIYPDDMQIDTLGEFIKSNNISTLWLTVGLFNYLATRNVSNFINVKQLITGGDVLNATIVRKALAELPNTKIINGYGPTEGTTFTCCYVISNPHDFGNTVPIGTPITGTLTYIVDTNLSLVSRGETGELLIGGEGVAIGYFNQPTLTNEKFIRNPFGDGYVYRSGDFVREREDHNLDFIGRSDRQAKIRGFRIELEEIEAIIVKHPDVREAAIFVYEKDMSDKDLIVYIVAQSNTYPTEKNILKFLKARLPNYMLPSRVIPIKSIPLTKTGKIDHKVLLEYFKNSQFNPKALLSEQSIDQEIISVVRNIWSSLLSTTEISSDDNFFDLGGHSIKATQMISHIEARWPNIRIGIDKIFTHPSLKEFSECIEAALENAHLATGQSAKDHTSSLYSKALENIDNLSDEEMDFLISQLEDIN